MTRTFKIVDGDFVQNPATGRFVFLEDIDKARQTMQRLLSLDRPWGAGIKALQGKVPLSGLASISAQLQRQVREAFDARVETQRGRQLKQRTRAERLAVITQMYVTPVTVDGANSKTGYAFRVDALNAANQAVDGGGVITG